MAAGGWKLVSLEVWGAGPTDQAARAPLPFVSCELPSHLWLAARRFEFTLYEIPPIPVSRNFVLGIAKLLPQIVAVKG